ncbi:MAG TPA: FHA domain-containing protein [Blastocatellia bacterium]|nr:FHA domain-containing protein [Blastocatellia bacterium]
MIRCNHCGTNNLDGSEYCDECGTRLTPAETPSPRQPYAPPAQFITQVAPPPPPSFTKDNVAPKPATPYAPPPPPALPSSGHSAPGDPAADPPGRGADRVRDRPPNRASDPALKPATSSAATPIGPPAANFPAPPNLPNLPNLMEAEALRTQGDGLAPNQTVSFNGQTNSLRGGSDSDGAKRRTLSDEKSRPPLGAKLIIQRGGKVGKEFPISGVEALIGRWDADGGIFPDVDLDQDDPEAKVSRRHARIQFLNDQYLIEDLGSTNGTFVNRGPRLSPGAKQPLKNGDEIIVGKTFLKFVLS